MKDVTEKLLMWKQLIKEKIENKILVKDWCLMNGVSRHMYYYWNQRINEKKIADEGLLFADITSSLSNDDAEVQNQVLVADLQISIHNIRFTIPNDFNPESLTGLMKILQAL